MEAIVKIGSIDPIDNLPIPVTAEMNNEYGELVRVKVGEVTKDLGDGSVEIRVDNERLIDLLKVGMAGMFSFEQEVK